MNRRRIRGAGLIATITVALAIPAGGCTSTGTSATPPACTAFQRLVLVAQSVPTASYVPCLATLPEGWGAGGFVPSRGETRFTLTSDRAAGRPVDVSFRPVCNVDEATPGVARAVGVRTYTKLDTISPHYKGTLYDVFSGGCVTYRFDFDRATHIGLMEDFEAAVNLYPRQQLATTVRQRLGIELEPS